MNIWKTLVVAAAILVTTMTSPVDAQILDTYDAGGPIQMRIVVIPANATVTFKTDRYMSTAMGASYPDTVLSLVELGSAHTFLGGADGWEGTPSCTGSNCCAGSFSYGPSCFTYTNTGSSPKVAWLIAHAWKAHTAATSRLWAYGPGQVNGAIGDWPNGGATGPVIVGGGQFLHTLQTSGRQHLSTVHRPGNADTHVMVIGSADTYYNAEQVYWLGTWNGSTVSSLAELDVTGLGQIPTANVSINYGGNGTGNIGAARVIENNWFGVHYVGWQTVPNDYDDDGLGYLLEQDLHTCDSPSDNMVSRSCSDFEFCDTDPTGDICMAQLRDSDHDGLPDDLEVYGYTDPLTHMARYGADPAHKDIFVELHSADRNATEPGCQGFQDIPAGDIGTIGDDGRSDFFERINQIYGQAPARLNPDNTPGISVHYDVGVPNPIASNTQWGDWGGGGHCFDGSEAPPGETLETAFRTVCNDSDTREDRAWLFKWGLDTSGRGQAGGTTGCYYSKNTAGHVHELGHVTGVSHTGPVHVSSYREGASNNWPTYFSRMNYAYSYVGLSNNADWNAMSFSSGGAGQNSSRTVSEDNPIPHQDLTALQSSGTSVQLIPGTDSYDVDWNDDGTFGGMTHMAAYREEENGRNARVLRNDPDFYTSAYGSHHDAVVVDDLLLYAYTRYDGPSSTPRTYLKAESDGTCPILPSGVPGEEPSYGACLEMGDRVDIGGTWGDDAISMTDALLPSSGATGILLVGRRASTLWWRYASVVPSTGSTEMSYSAFARMTMPTSWPAIDPSVDVTLVRVPGTNGTLLFYQDSNQLLRQAYLPPGGNTWSSAEIVKVGSNNLGEVTGDVGAVAHGGQVYVAARSPGQAIRLYALGVANQNTSWVLDNTLPTQTNVAGDIELVIGPVPEGDTAPEWYVLYHRLPGTNPSVHDDKIMETRSSDRVTWRTPDLMSKVPDERGFSAPALVFDERAITGIAYGLRSFRETHNLCRWNNRIACDSEGYWPAHPPLTCNLTTDYCETSAFGGRRPAVIRYSPFASGLHPTEFCDYDDWLGFDWGMCQQLVTRTAPLGARGHGSAYYNNHICRTRPVFPEPTASGQCVAGPARPAGDRLLHPNMYRW